MNATRLLQHFDRISEAPDAIPCLRQFILELAVRGKLVEHDPKDEPTSELLNRILAEKERRIRDEQLKKQEPLPHVRPDEAWFDVPTSWIWVRLGTITQVLMGQSPPGETYNKTGEGIPLINGPVEFTEGPFGKTVVNQYTTAPTNLCEEGDLLLCVRGSTTGRTNIAGFRACIGRGVAAIRPFFADQYVRLFVWRLRASIIAMGRGIAFPSVSRQQIEELPVPLPPLAEQHRIVTKVDELMALCDRLAAAQAERESGRDRLVAASLHRLNNGAAAESFREHARIHLRHLPRITTRPEHIQQLRQTILNLAVRGHLVPQDPNDEPASELLRRFEAKKAQLTKEGTIAKERASAPVDPGEVPAQLPVSWRWARTATLCKVIVDCPHSTPVFVPRGIICLDTNSFKDGALIPHKIRYVSDDTYKERVRRLVPRAGDVVFAREGSVGASVIVPDGMKCCLGQRVMLFRPMPGILSTYFSLSLSEPSSLARLIELHKGIGAKHVNVADMRNALIPLPPLAEQQRIVAKVDELMALCDRLEGQLTTGQAESRRLLEGTLSLALAA